MTANPLKSGQVEQPKRTKAEWVEHGNNALFRQGRHDIRWFIDRSGEIKLGPVSQAAAGGG